MKKIITSHVALLINLTMAYAQWDTIAKPAEFYPSVFLATHNSIMYCGGNAGVYKYNNTGWDDLTQGTFQDNSNSNNELVFISNYIYVRTTVQGIYRSANAGSSWEMDTVGLPLGEPFSLYADGTNLFLSYGYPSYGFYRKQPSAGSWTKLTDIGSNTKIVWGVTKKGSSLYAAVSNGFWESTDGGQSWTKKTGTGFPMTNTNWHLQGAGNTLITHNSDLYFGCENGLFKSADNGDSWSRIDAGFQVSFGAVTISALYSDGNSLYAATRGSSNAYKSTDHGANWTDISSGLPSKITSFTSYNGNMYVSLFNEKNLYRLGGGPSSVWEINTPSGIVVYPNPASESLYIKPAAGAFIRNIEMLNSNGQLVRKAEMNGNHSLNIKDLDKGLYFLLISTDKGLSLEKFSKQE